jgi:hypothetical protein
VFPCDETYFCHASIRHNESLLLVQRMLGHKSV